MDEKGIRQVLREVFGGEYQHAKVVNGWLSIRCPLSSWTHERGKDRHESAGIHINPNGVSVFNCFTCKNPAPLHGLLQKYANFSGEDLGDLIAELEDDAYLGPKTLPAWGQREEDDELVPLSKAVYLDLYDSAAGHPYLLDRGISEATARKLQLMVDPSDPADGEERILFPVFGADGELYGLSGRATSKTATLKVRDYYGLKKAANLLGAHLIAQENADKVCLVEGLFDYANAWECGQPAVAAMHSNLTERQAEILRNLGLPVYLFFDADEAGQRGVEIAGKALCNYVPTMRVRYPNVWIKNGDDEHFIKDPGELLKEEFDEMVRDARLFFPKG